MKKETYDVTGMSCAACSSRVEKAVAKQPGAQQVAVNLLKNSMVVEYDESQLSSAQIIAADSAIPIMVTPVLTLFFCRLFRVTLLKIFICESPRRG